MSDISTRSQRGRRSRAPIGSRRGGRRRRSQARSRSSPAPRRASASRSPGCSTTPGWPSPCSPAPRTSSWPWPPSSATARSRCACDVGDPDSVRDAFATIGDALRARRPAGEQRRDHRHVAPGRRRRRRTSTSHRRRQPARPDLVQPGRDPPARRGRWRRHREHLVARGGAGPALPVGVRRHQGRARDLHAHARRRVAARRASG